MSKHSDHTATNGSNRFIAAIDSLPWGKRRIMELYLNVIEWGPGVYGAEAAAQHYFHKPAAALTEREAVRLAAVIPDPLDWSPRRPRSAWIELNTAALPTARPCHAAAQAAFPPNLNADVTW
jgi:membrane peptidoglycan carboxypeptidase